MGKESIKEYFKGKTIFVTGGTGFIGKVLLEKLLRSCPNLKKIYVLIRSKKGKGPSERVEQFTSSYLFQLLKQKYPENIEKIKPINGDTSQVGLGLSEKDRHLLIDEVQIFFHTAASVKFDDFLKDAIVSNVRSAREVAFLALNMKKIEVFQHLSTTYCNIDNKKVVEPKLYPPHGDWRELIMLAEKCDTDTLNILSQKFIGDFPNTYTYTKQLAEHCINDLLSKKIPTVLFRPSVVINTIMEPLPGWVDNFNGPMGLMMGIGSGVLRAVYADPDVATDYVCVDNLVKCMIVAAWHKIHYGKKYELEIYNGSSYKHIPINFNDINKLKTKLSWDVPFSNKIWFPGNTFTNNWNKYFFIVIIFHMIPAFFIDLLMKAAGKKPKFFKLQRKVYVANMSISYFMLNDWLFVNTNTMALLDYIPIAEKKDFVFNIHLDSKEMRYKYLLSCADLARQVLLKEDKEITEKTRVMTKWMYYLDQACRWIFYVEAFWLIFIKINVLTLIWNILYDYFYEYL